VINLLPKAVISFTVVCIVISSEAVALSDKLTANEPMDSFTKSGGCVIFTPPTVVFLLKQ